MQTDTTRRLLIWLLGGTALILVLEIVQTTLLWRSTPEKSAHPEQTTERFSPEVAEEIAQKVVQPYNNGDTSQLYAAFDDLAKVQMSLEQLEKQTVNVLTVVGKVDSAAFAGSKAMPEQGPWPMYQLNYMVRLSGGNFSGGAMFITVVDRGDEYGVMGFFVNGTRQ